MKKRIKWNPRFITSLFIAFMCTLNCMAQNVIKGSVNDGSGEPLPGVSVAVKGTTSERYYHRLGWKVQYQCPK